MKWEHNFSNFVGTSSQPEEFDDLKDIYFQFLSGSTMIFNK
jgi:hypothetical protein